MTKDINEMEFAITIYGDEFVLWNHKTYEEIMLYRGYGLDYSYINSELRERLEQLNNNTFIYFNCSKKVEDEFKSNLINIHCFINEKDILVKVDRDRQNLLWQNELNRLGFLTKIENNQIIVVDKISRI